MSLKIAAETVTVSVTQRHMPMDVRSHINEGKMKQEELREINLGEDVYMHQYFLTKSLCKIVNKMKLQICISIGILVNQAPLLWFMTFPDAFDRTAV